MCDHCLISFSLEKTGELKNTARHESCKVNQTSLIMHELCLKYKARHLNSSAVSEASLKALWVLLQIYQRKICKVESLQSDRVRRKEMQIYNHRASPKVPYTTSSGSSGGKGKAVGTRECFRRLRRTEHAAQLRLTSHKRIRRPLLQTSLIQTFLRKDDPTKWLALFQKCKGMSLHHCPG